jgi:hypothetical protein
VRKRLIMPADILPGRSSISKNRSVQSRIFQMRRYVRTDIPAREPALLRGEAKIR